MHRDENHLVTPNVARMPHTNSLTLCALLVISICASMVSTQEAVAASLVPRQVAPKSLFGKVSAEFHRHDRLVIKFEEGSRVRLRSGRLVSLEPSFQLEELDSFFRRHPEIVVDRHFSRTEVELDLAQVSGQARSGRQLANLNLYYRFQAPAGTKPVTLEAWLTELHQLDVVETAFAEPIVSLASTTNDMTETIGGVQLPITPDYTPMQGYLSDSPSGVNADKVWAYPGGRGAGVKLIDIEGDWQWTHEDLEPAFFNAGTPIGGWRDHGTAVIGVIMGQENGLGITGIAADVEVGGISFSDFGVAGSIDLAAANIDKGDIFLIELHAPGPDAENGGGQYGYVPMEWWQDNFDAIQTAVANGRICVEAGGNGEQNLDAPIYQNLFDRNLRDSGAVMVGAGTPTGLSAEWFTNYGTRIDLNGWGSSIVTTGYGTLQGGDEDEWYTAGFGGTSGASPIICGAIASLQGMSKALWGVTLDTSLAVTMLQQTGTPYSGTLPIGKRPNLLAVRDLLVQGVGEIVGIVRDASTGDPVAGARLLVQSDESGASDRVVVSGPDGSYEIPLQTGLYNLTIDSFFHQSQTVPFTLTSGKRLVQDVDLVLLPTALLSGTIATSEGLPLSGVAVNLTNAPVSAESSDGAGQFSFSDLPVGFDYELLVGPTPGRQVARQTVSFFDGLDADVSISLKEAETFESDDGQFVPEGIWSWGAPTSGPGSAYSGTQLWATSLTGDYGPNLEIVLASPSFDTAGLTEVLLTFNHWYDIEAAYDGGQVEVFTGESWTRVDPIDGYPFVNVSALDWSAGYSGSSNGWEAALFDLTPFASADLRFRFRFASDSGAEGAGWYIDDVFVSAAQDPASVDANSNPTGTVANWDLSSAPNPFRESTRISFQLAEAAPVQIEVFDIAGRNLAVKDLGLLAPGRQTIDWNGASDRGPSVGTGVFFYRLRIGDETSTARQILRIR